ncbi:MAG: FHA domain-containing protein [Acetatifactor sp.]|nr:FHA domain-containing protein [Acetatifactor sp.]
MFQTEYLKNLNSNYERILLDKKPEENRYQYCILSRGGIKGLLPFSLRYINGLAYLYYDISSKQNVAQLFNTRCVTRQWMKDFLWSMQQIQQELGRFLLDDSNVLWYPEQIFQDLESNLFSFLYIPYYEGESSFGQLMDFLVEHVDYNDEVLADCVFHMYEQLERNGDVYLQAQIFEDAKMLEQLSVKTDRDRKGMDKKGTDKKGTDRKETEQESASAELKQHDIARQEDSDGNVLLERREEKKSILSLFDNKRRKSREIRENYKLEMQQAINGYAVAEESDFGDEEYGRTVYIEEKQEETERVYKLYTPEDKLAASVEKPIVTIGKKKGEVDVVLQDSSVSRMHARITREGKEYYLEDLNSTNGTFKNGLRLQPYEKRKLESGDELKCGRVTLIFR